MVAGSSELWKVEAQLWRREDDLQSGCRLEKLPFPRSRDFMSLGQGSDRSVDAAVWDGKSFGQLLVFSIMGWERTDIVVGGDRKLKDHGLEGVKTRGQWHKEMPGTARFPSESFWQLWGSFGRVWFFILQQCFMIWGQTLYKYSYYLLLTISLFADG